MAPFVFALALLMQDAPAAEPSSDAPVATAVPRKQDVAPLPIQGGSVSAPTDDYGYVGWCYGAISAYVELYDRAMPEVIRIERAWPTPSTEENIAVVYPAQREEAKRNLVLFTRAMEAAEKASPSPIQTQGAAAVRRGRAMWTGSTNVPKAQLAQFWMSWTPPARCEETARALETRSLLFGQALSYNARGAAPVVASPPPAAEPAAPALLLASPALTAPTEIVTPSEPVAETPADAAPAAEPEAAATPPLSVAPTEEAGQVDTAEASPSTAIDALMPATEPAAEAAPVAEAAPAPAPSAPTAPAKKRKRGLKDTLTGMRGPQ